MKLYRKTFSKEYKRELKESGVKDSDINQIARLKKRRNKLFEDEYQDAIVHGAETNEYDDFAKARGRVGSRVGVNVGGASGMVYGVAKSLKGSKGKSLGHRAVGAATRGITNAAVGSVVGGLVGKGVGYSGGKIAGEITKGAKDSDSAYDGLVQQRADQIRVARGDMSANDYADKYGRRK